ncbi:Hypothetical predicted protein [Olea europaea subsp. europaea]|uniref:Uncharacterized protein n=1 Tax=Olea europaea subsp. europaea TaxID=158383 RepID=A0A8S0SXK4_OLEEU|nr:Hypothetical predicted protein [Olea europaea subsp. europaea]
MEAPLTSSKGSTQTYEKTKKQGYEDYRSRSPHSGEASSQSAPIIQESLPIAQVVRYRKGGSRSRPRLAARLARELAIVAANMRAIFWQNAAMQELLGRMQGQLANSPQNNKKVVPPEREVNVDMVANYSTNQMTGETVVLSKYSNAIMSRRLNPFAKGGAKAYNCRVGLCNISQLEPTSQYISGEKSTIYCLLHPCRERQVGEENFEDDPSKEKDAMPEERARTLRKIPGHYPLNRGGVKALCCQAKLHSSSKEKSKKFRQKPHGIILSEALTQKVKATLLSLMD